MVPADKMGSQPTDVDGMSEALPTWTRRLEKWEKLRSSPPMVQWEKFRSSPPIVISKAALLRIMSAVQTVACIQARSPSKSISTECEPDDVSSSGTCTPPMEPSDTISCVKKHSTEHAPVRRTVSFQVEACPERCVQSPPAWCSCATRAQVTHLSMHPLPPLHCTGRPDRG